MKKLPILFERKFENNRVVGITDKVSPGMEWVLEGEGIATRKWDGSCCAIIGGAFYKRYDAKKGKTPPAGAIPCCDPDPVTGHHPHWVLVSRENPADKWFVDAFYNSLSLMYLHDGTYEAVGPKFNGDPDGFGLNRLVPHGRDGLENVPRTFKGIRHYLSLSNIEGIVFWKDGQPQCKIKRSDFGFPWPPKEVEHE